MTPQLASVLGAFAGLVFGLLDSVVLDQAGEAAGRDGARAFGPVVKVVRVLQLILLPVAGWFVGPLVASNIAG